MKRPIYSFPDHDQNFWQLACIQSAATGLPVIIVGDQFAARDGAGVAITSVILGNLILWVIGMSVISMAATGRENALQNISRYLGKIGGFSAAIFLILSFLSWYVLQIQSVDATISHLLFDDQMTLRIGAALGAFVALLAMGGIYLIKKYCTYVLPLLFLFVIYALIRHPPNMSLDYSPGLSIRSIVAVVAITLPGIVNLPTFFRHSRSLGDSFAGLSVMTIFVIIFQVFSILIGFNSTEDVPTNDKVYIALFIAFMFLSLISVNLVNIYFASAGWEMIFPHRKTNMEFTIVGLLGTLTYTFIQIAQPMLLIFSIAENFLASLGVILLLSFMTKTFVQHRPKFFEKTTNLSCWFFGAIIGTVYTWDGNIGSPETVIVSFCASTIAFIAIIYMEETVWSAKKLIVKRET